MRSQLGLSLIEVLVTLVIAAVSLLGLAGLQARALSMQLDTENRRVAVALINQLRERITANPQGYSSALTTHYTQALGIGQAITVPACPSTGCDPVAGAPRVIVAQWFSDLQRQLPSAVAQLGPTQPGSSVSMSVSVGWIEPNAQTIANDGACARIESVATDARFRCVTITFVPG